MSLHDLVSQLLIDTFGDAQGGWFSATRDSSLAAFLPETALVGAMLTLLLVKLFRWGDRLDEILHRLFGGGLAFTVTLLGVSVALVHAAPWALLRPAAAGDPAAIGRMEIFTGMLVYDGFTVYIRAFLLLFALLFVVFTRVTGVPDRADGPDVYSLVLGATLGMCLMASANHLLMVFVAIEMASVPSYVLAGLFKGKRAASEAALKYAVYGAGAAGVMLYGLSLVVGLLGTAHLPTIAVRLAEKWPAMQAEPSQLVVLGLASLMVMVGLAYKLSAVPFHFWAPDVFEGASAEVNAFLSVASKGAALALLARMAIGFGCLPAEGVAPGQRSAALAAAASGGELSGNMAVASRWQADPAQPGGADPAPAASNRAEARAQTMERLAPAREFLAKLIAFVSIITCTFGNLAAYAQTNLKRLFAYSTIAHAGYMMMPVPALLAMAQVDPRGAEAAVSSLCVYIGVYLFMNLGAFAIVAFMRNARLGENVADCAGLLRRCPVVAISFVIILFSLVGLPPLAGFIGKFAVFASLAEGWRVTHEQGQPANYLLVLLLAGGVNTAISLFYYLRVAKELTMSPEPAGRNAAGLSEWSPAGAFIALQAAATVGLFVSWDFLNQLAQAATRHLLS